MLFVLFWRPAFILCRSSVRRWWCPFTFAFGVLIGLCPSAEGYWNWMKVKHSVGWGCWPQDNDSKLRGDWKKGSGGRCSSISFIKMYIILPHPPAWELPTLESHCISLMCHIPWKCEGFSGISEAFLFHFFSQINHLPWSCNTFYWDRARRLRSKEHASLLFLIGLSSFWSILETG